ncbi:MULTISPECIES: DUF3597 family protein [unclassified Pseudomonas]|uniref:DUF3597 family protein n=1 Tax=unclassified Pseudomonas TaxID=196821 RepID=UPI0025FAA1CE|nr:MULTISPECIES: DUF3597 family protein [unclassified Pseudomonas]
MSFFNKILSALGIGHAEASTQASSDPSAAPATGGTAAPAGTAPTGATSAAAAAPATKEQVDAKLDSLAKDHPTLNPKESIVDLLKALNLPNDLASRKQLAGEVGMSGDYTGTADQNIELHGKVLTKAASGNGSV